MDRYGRLPTQIVEEEMRREHAERRAWIAKRVQESSDIAALLDASVQAKREQSQAEQWYHEAEVTGLTLGVRQALWINGLPDRLDEVDGFATRLAQIDPELRVIGNFAFHRGRVESFFKHHPDLAASVGWDGESVDEFVRQLNELIDSNEENEIPGKNFIAQVPPELHRAIGTLLGFPEASIEGFARERMIADQTGAPTPQEFFETLGLEPFVKANFSRDDQAIYYSIQSRQKDEFERIRALPPDKRTRALGKLRTENYERLRPHLARWYRTYWKLNPSDAEHLAGKRRVELYLGDAPNSFINFGAYGEENEEEKKLKRDATEISNHLSYATHLEY